LRIFLLWYFLAVTTFLSEGFMMMKPSDVAAARARVDLARCGPTLEAVSLRRGAYLPGLHVNAPNLFRTEMPDRQIPCAHHTDCIYTFPLR
uniref:Uncharacterized protein n=1 Tax=Myripristis murdjan TaxID=586833 RepID=A0A667Z1X0_9TELE